MIEFEEGKAKELIGNATLYTWNEDESPYDLVYTILGSPSSGVRVAVEPETRFFIQDGLAKSFGPGNSVVSAMEVVRNTRGLKSTSEVNILRCANEATKRAIALVADQLFEGITEVETSALMASALMTAGLTNVWTLILFGERYFAGPPLLLFLTFPLITTESRSRECRVSSWFHK